MSTLTLTPEQATILKDSLASYLSDLRLEIADTDKQDFRENLKHKEAVLKEILSMLE